MGKTLRADIVVGGKADSSFYRLGSELETLGSQVNLISEKLIQFGKESVDAFTGYEDYMLDAEVALRTQYESASELGKVMGQLQKASLQWARDSRFTTEDVAGAIDTAAHAGWNLEKILTGVPNAMKISLAGGMELSQGLEYLVDISNAAGIGFEELGELTDYWAYAANRSSTTIPEMGAAMQKMGATMRFVKGDMAGLTTMLAVLANNGTKGTEAGTLLRNSMIRLIAPTKAAADAMDLIGMSADELDEIYSNSAGLEETVTLLKDAGFSAYDSRGDLKSFLEIFQDLNRVTSSMTEEERNSVLSTIFPTRTITGALALLNAAADGWDGLYESIQNNGDGYAEYAAKTMESGLGGKLRHLESVYNALQTRTGSALSEDVGTGADFISSVIDSFNNMDDAKFGAIVSGLEVVAAAGPGMMAVGGAFKLFGALFGTGPVGKIILGVTALAALVAGMNKFNEEKYMDKFGSLSADTEQINAYISSLSKGFEAARSEVDKYNQAVEAAFTDYETASGSLKESLLTSLLTKKTLSESDKQSMMALGDQMRKALLDGINGSYSRSNETVALFAGDNVVLTDNEDGLWAGILDTLEYGYGQAIAKAEELSNNLRNALTSALSDGGLTNEEISGIQDIINQQNELFSLQTDAKNATERQKMLRQAQNMGIGSLEEIGSLVQTQRDAELAALEESYWDAYYQTELGGQWKIKNGYKKADGTLYTQADLDRELEALYYGDPNDPTDGYMGKRLGVTADYNRILLDAFSSTADGSEFQDVWRGLGEMADSYLASGVLTNSAMIQYQKGFGGSERSDIAKYTSDMIEAFGGIEEVKNLAGYFADAGDLETAYAFSRMATMYALTEYQKNSMLGAPSYGAVLDVANPMYGAGKYSVEMARAQNESLVSQDQMAALAWGAMAEAMRSGDPNEFKNYMSGNFTDTGFQDGIRGIVDGLQSVYDLSSVAVPKGLESVHDYAAAYRLMFDETINAGDYAKQGIEISVTGNTNPLQESIAALDGTVIGVNVALNGVSGIGGTEANGGTTAHGGIGGAFAEGGRADRASIFGEAGPEWAIPEEHSQRTADLLNAAREASGFTWPELLSRNGGLNAGSGGNWTLVYSPTIVANDAAGVEEKLTADKDRMEKWMKELKLREKLEVYA